MKIIFCADQNVIAGLHVTAYSILQNITVTPSFSVYTDALTEDDLALLKRSLDTLEKPYSIDMRPINTTVFSTFPKLNGSWATYYRLYAANTVESDRFLYVDVDILCDIDLAPLNTIDMKGYAIAWVPEAPINQAVDVEVAQALGKYKDAYYHNAGVMLVDTKRWKAQQISKSAMTYIAEHSPAFHDQSALNVICHRNALSLSSDYNSFSNDRKNWKQLVKPYGQINRLVHFLDYPKPWDRLGNVLHPMYTPWNFVLKQTAYESNDKTHTHKRIQIKNFKRYKKTFKDKILFLLYRSGFKNIKGT